ncbi:hypothetical protein JCM8097_006741 [Rhodosporidiobolus ruineniae]
MDKFGSAKGAFAQARALAESGRSQVTKQFDKVDARYPIGGGQKKPSSASGDGGAESPGLATHTSSAPPPPPPTRGSGPPPPVGRGRATSGASVSSGVGAGASRVGGGAGGGSVFVNMPSAEKEAFFALLDEYFSSRPHLAHLFQPTTSSSSSSSAPAPPAASRPAPPATPTRRGVGTAVALYDFEAGQTEDLSFSEGDRIEVLEIVSDDWYRGALNGREGIFPSSYVQMQG